MIFSRIFPEAEALNNPDVRKEVFKTLRNNAKSDDPSIRATAFSNISITYFAAGRYEKAERWQKKAIELREKLVDEHRYLAKSYSNLSVICCTTGRYIEALKWQKKAISIFKKNLGINRSSLITSYNYLSSIYESLGEEKKALLYKSKAEKLNLKM